MDGASYTGVANGNIQPCRFVVADGTGTAPYAANLVVQATGATVGLFGISQKSTRYVPWAPLDDGYAAVAGEMLQIHGLGDDEALLAISATVVNGQELTSDSGGMGTPAASGNYVGAIAKQEGNAGDQIRVRPIRYKLP
ncbi:hypothetical protein [Fimbriiglobus ruber]|nr:hypothetical protein [Fimbriiglobus ruber]